MNRKKIFIVIVTIIIFLFSCKKTSKIWQYNLGETLKVQTIPLFVKENNIIVTWRVDIVELENSNENSRYVVPKVKTIKPGISMKLQNKEFQAKLVAVNYQNGEEVWKTEKIGESDQNLSSPVYYDGKIYVGSDNNKIYEIDSQTGKILWSYDTGSWIYATPFVNEEFILIGNEDGFLYLWRRDSKELIFKKKLGYIEKKSYIYKNNIYSVVNNIIYEIDFEGNITNKYKVMDSYLNFSNEEVMGAQIVSKLEFFDNYCFFTAKSEYLYKLNLKTGNITWKKEIDLSFSNPLYKNKKIYLGTKNGVVEIDSIDGDILNHFETRNRWIDFNMRFRNGGPVNGSLMRENNYLYFGSYDYSLYKYNLENKKLVWQYKIKHHIDRTGPISVNKYICFGADSHHLYLVEK